jgi:hypothetical protein
VQVATDATDRLAAARQLLIPLAVPAADAGSGTESLTVRLGGGTTWAVTADDLRDGDGRTVVRYRISPAS